MSAIATVSKKLTLAAAVLVAVGSMALPEKALAEACARFICASSTTGSGRMINVRYRYDGSHMEDFFVNIRSSNFPSGPGQREGGLAGRFQLYAARGETAVRYSIQRCLRGGTFQRSICQPWANFVHRMPQ